MSATFEELLETEEEERMEYITEGVLGAGQVALLAAPAYSFKSILALNMVHALGSGTKVFEHFDVPAPVPVGLFDKEIGRFYLKRRLAIFYGDEKTPPPLCRISTPEDEETDFHLDHGESLDLLRAEIDANQLKVVVLDCLNPFLGEDENSDTFKTFTSNIDRLRREYPDLAIIIIHHMAQLAMGSDPYSLSNIRGHGKLADWPATRILVHRKDAKSKTLPTRLGSRWALRHGPEVSLNLVVQPNFHVTAVSNSLRGL